MPQLSVWNIRNLPDNKAQLLYSSPSQLYSEHKLFYRKLHYLYQNTKIRRIDTQNFFLGHKNNKELHWLMHLPPFPKLNINKKPTMNELHSPADIHKWRGKEIIPSGNYQMIDSMSLKQISKSTNISEIVLNKYKHSKDIMKLACWCQNSLYPY